MSAFFYFPFNHIAIRTWCILWYHCLGSWLVESIGYIPNNHAGRVFRRNSRIMRFHNQRDLKDELTHICHFTVEETTGDLDSSRVTKLMKGNAKTRMQTLSPELVHLFKTFKFKKVQGRLHLLGFKCIKNHSSFLQDFTTKRFFWNKIPGIYFYSLNHSIILVLPMGQVLFWFYV